MFFTQEDYKKIQQWLTKNSVKDTEFNEANIPFNGNEIVSIVQGNQNKKVFLKDLIAQIFNLGVSDFVNITDKYDAPNISLEEAIKLIPSRARKEGQVITFLDREDHWHIYQFKGVLNQWNVLDTWEDLFDWEKLIIDSILPDEEDLTKSLPDENGNSYLSLKDREYNPEDFSGLGKVILRKNIVEIEDPTYGKVKKNVLYQDMFTQSNTVYECRYDFDLNGQDIILPDNSYIEYKGGSISNGTILDAAKGISRIVLKKNIINGKNILTQDMINKENTIYEIRYDFDLNGATIIIPQGCVLKFVGGSLHNGTLNCNKTNFIGLDKNCFTNIKFAGTIINNNVSPSWFGISPSLSKEDITNQQSEFDCLSSFIRCQSDCILTFEAGYYGFGGEGEVQEGWIGSKLYSSYRYYALCLSGSNLKSLSINGNNAFFINMVKCHYGGWSREGNVYTKIDDDGTFRYNTTGGGFLYIRLSSYLNSLEIYNITVDYTKDRYYGGWTAASHTQSALTIDCNTGNLVIKHCSLYNNMTDGISASGGSFNDVLIQHCNISNSGRSGISLDTSNNAVIDNCNILYSGDVDFDLDGYRFEGPGCAINSEPTVDHTKNLTITNCKFYGCAYTYISLGYTNKIANENVIIDNVEAKGLRTAFTIINTKTTQLSILENCPSFVYGTVVKYLSITNIDLTDVFLNLSKLTITNRSEDLSTDRISIIEKNIKIHTSRDIEILYSEKFPQDRFLIMTEFDTSFVSDNPEVTKDNKDYIIQIEGVSIELLSNRLFKTNIRGDKKLNVDDIYVYVTESRNSGICNNSNIFSQGEYTTNINNITVINQAKINSTLSDYFLYKAAKYIKVINDFDKNNEINFINSNSSRTLRLADTRNNKEYGSYSQSVNFLKLATDDAKELYFGIVGNYPQLVQQMNDGSIVINDTVRTLYKDVLFSLVNSGEYSAFYGVKKGLPYASISTLEVGPFTPLIGECVFYTKTNEPIWWTGSKWVDAKGNPPGVATFGTFENRPSSDTGIKAGFTYFCTNKHSIESNLDGFPIYYKENNTWVDALGRVVS